MNKLKSLIESGLVDRGDGTIFDTRTNLIWQQSPSNKMYIWKEANQYCKKLTLAGHKDWRLPTIEELKTLINTRYNPTIDPIFKCKKMWYWSSSAAVSVPANAWYVNFFSGFVGNVSKANDNYVRAVRRGP